MDHINLESLGSYSTRQLKELHKELLGVTTESNNRNYLMNKIERRLLLLKAQEARSSRMDDHPSDDSIVAPNEPSPSVEPGRATSPETLVGEPAGEPIEQPTPNDEQVTALRVAEAIVASAEQTPAAASEIQRESPQVDVLVPNALAETPVDAIVPDKLASESEARRAAPVCPTCGARIRSKNAPSRPQNPTRSRKSFRESGTRDPRIPPIGTVLTREFKGVTYTATVLAEGFEYEGKQWNSLSGIAKDITGNMWNGLLFWGLTPPPSRRRFATSPQTPDGPTLESSET